LVVVCCAEALVVCDLFARDRMPLFEKAPRQFYILPQNWQRVFFCGFNSVSGSVILDLVEPKKTRGVFVQLIGTATTRWTDTETYTDSKGETKTRKVVRSDSVEIIHLSTPAWLPQSGLEADLLPPGQYSLPFAFSTPPNINLPPNFDMSYGKITYVLKANIDRPWKYDHRCFLPITLLPVIDCNDPRYGTELNRHEEKTMCCCCCASGPIIATARIPAAAWCPGECVPFLVTVENHTNSAMEDVTCSLDCQTNFYAGHHNKSESKRVAAVKLGRQIPPQGEIREVMYLRIPSCCPSFSRQIGRIISHEYWLHVTVHLPAGSFNMHLRMPCTIGTIPHMAPPLFAEQRAQMQQQAPVYSWASPEQITKMVASAPAPSAPSAPTTYEDAYTESADPDASTLGGQMQYVYFEMPQPSAPPMFASAPPAGSERAPLLSSPPAGVPASTQPDTTTASAPFAPGAAPTSMFAAPAQVMDLPSD